jgi:hypothetical protein
MIFGRYDERGEQARSAIAAESASGSRSTELPDRSPRTLYPETGRS